MTRFGLDASALLALLFGEPGAELVADADMKHAEYASAVAGKRMPQNK